MHLAAHERSRVAARDAHRGLEVLIPPPSGELGHPRRQAQHVAVAVRPPQVADAVRAEPDAHARLTEFGQRQPRCVDWRDRGDRDAGIRHRLDQRTLADGLNVADRETVRDVHPARQTQCPRALDDQLVLERAEFAAVVQMDVDSHPAPVGDSEERVELPDRVTIDGGRVEPADVVGALRGGAVEQVEHAGTPEHSVLRERDDLQPDRRADPGDRVANMTDAVQPDPEIDIDVRTERRRSQAHHLRQQRRRRGDARDAQLVTVRPLVPDTPLRRRLTAVRHPREPEPALVQVRVGVDEPGKAQEPAAVHEHGVRSAGQRARIVGVVREHRRDASARHSQVDCRATPRPDVPEYEFGHPPPLLRGTPPPQGNGTGRPYLSAKRSVALIRACRMPGSSNA